MGLYYESLVIYRSFCGFYCEGWNGLLQEVGSFDNFFIFINFLLGFLFF